MPHSGVFWKFPVLPGMTPHRSPDGFAKDLKKVMGRALVTIQADHAYYASRYLLSFGYHAKGKPKPWTMFKSAIRSSGGRGGFARDYYESGNVGPADMGDGWSLFYAINWRIGIGTPDLTVGPGRRAFDEKRNRFAQYMPVSFSLATSSLQEFSRAGKLGRIHLTNSVWYGDWLNRGGYELEGTFLKVSAPNRFIERCDDYLRRRSRMITDLALARLGLPTAGNWKHAPRFAGLDEIGGE